MAKIKIENTKPKWLKPYKKTFNTYEQMRSWIHRNGERNERSEKVYMTYKRIGKEYLLVKGNHGVETAVFYNKEKRNTKHKVRVITKGKDKGKKIRELVRSAHWVVWIYEIPLQNLIAGKQNTRNFEISVKF